MAKSITVGIVIYEMVKYQEKNISLIFNIVSIVALVVSLLSEFIIHFVALYFDYLRLGFELDSNKSILLNLNPTNTAAKIMDKVNAKITKRKRYTNEEDKIRDMLIAEAKKMKNDKKQQNLLSIKQNSLEILQNCKSKIETK